MHTNQLPKTVARWIAANHDKVWLKKNGEPDVDIEPDEWGTAEGLGDWSIWCYLKPGLVDALTECHHIHEPTAKEFLEHASMIKKCECDDCLQCIANGDGQ